MPGRRLSCGTASRLDEDVTMRHQKRGRKLGRTAAHRKAMLSNMAASLITYERIQTTDTKAKALRPYVEKLVTLSKRGDLHARRMVLSRIGDKSATHKLFADLADRMREREGGYTRIVKLGWRKGDNAPVSLIEWVDTDLERVMDARGMEVDDDDRVDIAGDEEEEVAEEEAEEEEE